MIYYVLGWFYQKTTKIYLPLSKKERKALKDLEKQKRKIAESELKIYEAQKLLDKNGVTILRPDDDMASRKNLILTARRKTFGAPKSQKSGETKAKLSSARGVKIAKNAKVKANQPKENGLP